MKRDKKKTSKKCPNRNNILVNDFTLKNLHCARQRLVAVDSKVQYGPLLTVLKQYSSGLSIYKQYTYTTTVNLYYNGIFPELVVSSKRGCRPTSLHRFRFLLLFGHRHATQSSSPTTASCRPSVRSTMRPQKKHAISAASASASVV